MGSSRPSRTSWQVSELACCFSCRGIPGFSFAVQLYPWECKIVLNAFLNTILSFSTCCLTSLPSFKVQMKCHLLHAFLRSLPHVCRMLFIEHGDKLFYRIHSFVHQLLSLVGQWAHQGHTLHLSFSPMLIRASDLYTMTINVCCWLNEGSSIYRVCVLLPGMVRCFCWLPLALHCNFQGATQDLPWQHPLLQQLSPTLPWLGERVWVWVKNKKRIPRCH